MLVDVVVLAPGTFHTLLMQQDGSVWSTGVSSDAQSESFVQVIPSGATAVAAGTGASVVLKQDGSVWTTYKKARGQLSFFGGSVSDKRTFSAVKIISGANAVGLGSYHAMVLTKKGRVWAAGWNKYGQLGDGSTLTRTRFVRSVFSGAKVVALAAGDTHSIVLKQDGSAWTVGQNNNGQLGDGSQTDRKSFVMVISSGGADVVAGGYHTMVLKQDGSVWAAGWNEYGQLGDGTTTNRVSYVQVVPAGTKAVAAGSRHTMILQQDDSVWATGYNEYGQLGTGSTINSDVFVQVISDGAKIVAAGAFHSMVLKKDDSIWATGSNKHGQFGDGSTKSENRFVRLTINRNGMGNAHARIIVVSICVIFYHLMAAMHSTVQLTTAADAPSTTVIERKATNECGICLARGMCFSWNVLADIEGV